MLNAWDHMRNAIEELNDIDVSVLNPKMIEQLQLIHKMLCSTNADLSDEIDKHIEKYNLDSVYCDSESVAFNPVFVNDDGDYDVIEYRDASDAWEDLMWEMLEDRD